jgi:hypothetical protein
MNRVLARLRQSSSVAVVAAVLLWPAALFAQNPPLAEVAKKEQERKKTVKPAAKVLTNQDLPKVTAPPVATAPAAETQAANEQKPAEPEKKEERDEAWWRARITAARKALSNDETFIEALQSRVNALSADFVNRDDPYQRARIGEDRQKALAEMDRVKADLALHKKQVEDIEEEARKASVPPGWLR